MVLNGRDSVAVCGILVYETSLIAVHHFEGESLA